MRAILAYLQTAPGVVAWRMNVGAVQAERHGVTRFVRFGFPGLSDIVGWINGTVDVIWPWSPTGSRREPLARFLAIEVKRPGKPLSRPQQAFGDLVTSSGGLFIYATCVQDVVDAFAKARGR